MGNVGSHIPCDIIEKLIRRTRDGCSGASSMCVPSVGGVLADGGRRRCCSHLHLLLRKAEPSPPVQKRSRLQRPCSTGRPAAEFRLRHPPACTGEFLRMQQQQQSKGKRMGGSRSGGTYAAWLDFDLRSTLVDASTRIHAFIVTHWFTDESWAKAEFGTIL